MAEGLGGRAFVNLVVLLVVVGGAAGELSPVAEEEDGKVGFGGSKDEDGGPEPVVEVGRLCSVFMSC